MHKHFVPTAIAALKLIFFRKTTKSNWLALKTLEYYCDELNLLADAETVAFHVEAQSAFALVPQFRKLDSMATNEIEKYLQGRR
ncbi:hypothetical protein [Fictibacillus sp. S7]|uniref:hypothetical protein n=1 Tax=Fictibacillus sp. S7 TaxID=2212476 RepID=UPI001011B382|nr:hypothetical protein [Fictibacillus sp. S7]RXY98553.1 hypothetical protein DMO16_02095 [Fictibacillus sp. S7]